MNENPMRDLVCLLSGKWRGAETVMIDPSTQSTIEATGSFENAPAFGGAGLRAEYTQEMDGTIGLVCETCYRFAADGKVTMVWFPMDGDPQILRGHHEGAVITVSREDDGGLIHTLVTDYSQMGTATISMAVGPAGESPMTVFSGEYLRRGTAEGGVR